MLFILDIGLGHIGGWMQAEDITDRSSWIQLDARELQSMWASYKAVHFLQIKPANKLTNQRNNSWSYVRERAPVTGYEPSRLAKTLENQGKRSQKDSSRPPVPCSFSQ